MSTEAAKKEITVHLEEEVDRKRRELSGPLNWVSRVLAIGLTGYSFIFIMDLLSFFDIQIYSGTHNAIFLAVVLTLVFMHVPATKKAPKRYVPWYDFVLIALGLAGTTYIGINFETLIVRGGVGISPLQITLGFLTLVAVFEAVRRTSGWVMIVVALFFLIHAKFTYLFPGILHGPQFSNARVMNYLYLSNQGIFGMVLGIASTIIIAFMIFGAFLGMSGAGDTFIKLSLALLGHVRGGAAKVAILGSALFGMVTGSPVAEIGVIGTFTIPLMKRIGYSPTFAAAVEASAATGGAIMPPVMGAVAFVMADFTGLGYSAVAVAAIMPGVLYFLSIYFQLDLRAAATGLKGLPREELPKVKDALKEGWLFFVPIAVLVVWMMVMHEEPIRAVFIALAVLIMLSFLNPRNRFTIKKILKGMESAGMGMIDITPICALAGIIVGSITLTGLGINLSGLLIRFSGGSLLLLSILTAVAIYIMGMGVAVVATYILMAVLVAPAMVQMGVPVLVAHFFIFYIGVSMFITPPYAPAAYVAAAVAGADPMRVGFQSMKLAIVAYLVPFISIFQPALLWEGTPVEVAAAFVTAIFAVFALSVGIEGFFLERLHLCERPIWLAAGFALFVPKISLIPLGMALFIVGTLIQLRKRKARRSMEVATGRA